MNAECRWSSFTVTEMLPMSSSKDEMPSAEKNATNDTEDIKNSGTHEPAQNPCDAADLQQINGTCSEKLASVKSKIASGYYDSDALLEEALRRMISRMRNSDDSDEAGT